MVNPSFLPTTMLFSRILAALRGERRGSTPEPFASKCHVPGTVLDSLATGSSRVEADVYGEALPDVPNPLRQFTNAIRVFGPLQDRAELGLEGFKGEIGAAAVEVER